MLLEKRRLKLTTEAVCVAEKNGRVLFTSESLFGGHIY